ncbi:large conductance mechanosensitive channel protein MscL [Ammoniphilus sp. YIM 78166]|uniref:large conductance mechanosensitive channel protein MscL n=1 Tax=Ammoniphilus sp. YIM 78166 TaxID=1644106 RepID=UPI00106FAA23|nr:large conductance mechanosensitive channel protein MscL [Ammoniphilus sp. YIM 78166]
MNWLTDFKEFIKRGNVLELAIGVAIGTAFNRIVTSLVEDILMPPIGLFVGGVDFSHLRIPLEAEVTINYGSFVNHVIHFLIIALSLYLVFRTASSLQRRSIERTPPMKSCPMCYSQIPRDAKRCSFCTSYLIRSNVKKQRSNREWHSASNERN